MDKHHKGTETLTNVIKEKTFTILESNSNLAPNMLAKVTEAIERRFNRSLFRIVESNQSEDDLFHSIQKDSFKPFQNDYP